MFAEGGREFTAIVLDVGTGNVSRPVTLLPTEVKNHLISCEVSHGHLGINLGTFLIKHRYQIIIRELFYM
jgi:hypothetical protein